MYRSTLPTNSKLQNLKSTNLSCTELYIDGFCGSEIVKRSVGYLYT